LKKMITAGSALAAFALVAAAIAAATPQQPVSLKGTVGPGFTITLTKSGQRVRTLRAGTYRFVIADRASIHNFVLEKESGGRFERELTDESEVGTKVATLRLTPGKWKYYCDPHESTMFGTFVVR
jgi:plastocyanin